MSKIELSELDFFSAEVQECPFHVYQQLQEEAPVWQMPGTNVFVVTRYDDIREIIRDPSQFSSSFSALLNTGSSNEEVNSIYGQGYEMVETLLTQDPPRHRVYRNLVNKVFSNKRIEGMRNEVEKMSHELIDSWIDESEVDLLNRFCVPLPIYVISDQLGVPRSELPLIKKWSDASASRLGRLASEEEQIQNAKDIVEFQHYFAGLIDRMRESPEDNIISDLANNTIDEGRLLTKPEALGMIQQILVAGNETSTSAIAGGVVLLIQNPEQQAMLRQHPDLLPGAVEEILRLETPTTGMWRRATADTEIGGVDIPEGAFLMVRFAAGNRDESIFRDGGAMSIARENADSHLAFGQGTHFCLGAQLARMELQVALTGLLNRTTDWALVEGKNSLRHSPNVLLRGLTDLHIAFKKTAH
ncbi:cytochrome P450 [Luminiphilus sp.]|nr:cytochrome P450 [Luminiphilus sp.]MDA8985558.1 cytochrome P450 [Luminiphilus sp.]MDA9941794.1 cytochrome P450 [Luminiphilus sp.]MDB2645074.1 cytochrome P450 [Luminiphilus sp.]MDB4048600.1 cytochrome P450 [Luminiphilus sp.]